MISFTHIGVFRDMAMAAKNSHIEEFLEDYYRLPVAPGYAVLLKGQWGSGKTWFIERSAKRLVKNGGRTLYVSLYGIASTEGIERELFRQLHPVLGSKAMTIASKALFGALRGALKIEDITLSMATPEINLPEYLTKLEGALLIFDDLERCSIPIEELLGYLNHFVEHGGHKMVLVANEDEIVQRSDAGPDSSPRYERIKEKLVGKTFEIEPDVEEAVAVFASELVSAQVQSVLKSNESFILELYEASRYRNLRHLRQALFDFERLFRVLPEPAVVKHDLVRQVLGLYLIYSFEIKSGSMRPTDIVGMRESYYLSMIRDDEKSKTARIFARLASKYVGFHIAKSPIQEANWAQLFEAGVPDAKAISESVMASTYFAAENSPAWRRLWYAMDLTDEEVRQLLNIVVREWEQGGYTEAGAVLHVAGMLLWLEEIGVYTVAERSSIVEGAKANLQALRARGQLRAPEQPTTARRSDTGLEGLGFHSSTSAEFIEIREFAEQQSAQARLDAYPSEANSLLEILEADPHRFSRMIIHNGHEDNCYYNTPILAFIEPATFVRRYLHAQPAGQLAVSSAIRERYRQEFFQENLKEEVEWLDEVARLLRAESHTRAGSMSGYRLKVAVTAFEDSCAALAETSSE